MSKLPLVRSILLLALSTAGTGLPDLKPGLAFLAVAAASLSASVNLPPPPLGVAARDIDGAGEPVRSEVAVGATSAETIALLSVAHAPEEEEGERYL